MNAQEYKIKGWVARDGDGELNLFWTRPSRSNSIFNDWYPREYIAFLLDTDLFPELKWESEPIEVELTIKKV